MTDPPRRAPSRLIGLLEAVARGALRSLAARWQDLLKARELCSWNGLKRIREFPELVERLHADGGLRVVTGDSPRRPLASTLLTPSGDVISRVSPELFRQPALWQRHLRNVRQSLVPLQQVAGLLRSLSGLVTVIVAGLGVYFTAGMVPFMDSGLEEIRARATDLAGQLVWPATTGAVAGGVRYGLQLWLEARIKALMS